jgi:hypothetical protein
MIFSSISEFRLNQIVVVVVLEVQWNKWGRSISAKVGFSDGTNESAVALSLGGLVPVSQRRKR